jgi:PBP1b-binding outer membrane lipoprotein LpoB
MKTHIQTLIGVLIVALFLGSCQKELTPGETVKQWIYAVEKEDVETLMEITAIPEGTPAFSKEQWEKLIIPEVIKDIREKGGIKEISIEEEQYNNEKVAPGHAFVQHTITYNNDSKNESETISLVNQDGIWKVMME